MGDGKMYQNKNMKADVRVLSANPISHVHFSSLIFSCCGSQPA